jgi:hypothetical protein
LAYRHISQPTHRVDYIYRVTPEESVDGAAGI